MMMFMIAVNAARATTGCANVVDSQFADEDFYRESVVDDWIGIDWLTGEFTEKKDRLQRELEWSCCGCEL